LISDRRPLTLYIRKFTYIQILHLSTDERQLAKILHGPVLTTRGEASDY